MYDLDYKFLHDRVSALFAELLRSDIKLLANRESQKISLAAKWCPSLDSSLDRSTLLCESIAKKVFPREEHTEYEGVEEAHYAYRVRDRLRKQVYIGQNQWHLIPYNRVASVAMKNYKEKFLKHDTLSSEEYLNNVKSGKAKIAAGALLPHEIISCLEDEDGGQVAELQWNRMVEDMLKKGKLNNCLAICDVSGSMCGTPMEVCVALGVLVSELSEDPWKGKVITFSENPELETVQGDDLRSKIEFVNTMDWGMNTDFQKVFDLILEVASSGRLSEDEMVKRVFVFSDMEFDQASVNPWETDYQVIKRKFIEKGYGGAVPEMVFWNLRDSQATPVAGKENGVALVSGFSKNLMTLFMEDGGQLNPESVMDSAISGEEYKKLVLVD
ncbi:putative von Willebrand factor A-like domain superfamily [Helianthus anomalus]